MADHFIDNVQAIIDAARKGMDPVVLASGTHAQIIYTPTLGVQTVDMDKLRDVPVRKRGSVTVFDAASLNKILADNAIVGATTIYVNPDADKPAIVAVLNGNGVTGPGFGDFRASISFRPTPQWEKWTRIDGKLLPQVEFAEFCEENLVDIASPDSATIMEIVTYLQATQSTEFKSGVRLDNGQIQFTNLENVEAKVGSGQVAVPSILKLALAPIFGVEPFEIPARFRYRIIDRKLVMGIKLQRVEDVMGTTIKDIEKELVLPEGVAKVYGIAPSS